MSQEQQENTEQPKEVLTEVTSVAKEEAKTGQKIPTPSREELVARASTSMIVDLKRLESLLNEKQIGGKNKIGNHGLKRVLLSILQLPTEGIPVNLQNDSEKLAFMLGQKLLSSRFILIQDHISQEVAKQNEAKANAEAENKQGETNV